jgi:ADP-heptose:LPS heptosyltransferase
MILNHSPGHEQALIKNKLVTVVLFFEDHNVEKMKEVFSNFEYDLVLDMCFLNKNAILNSIWNGKDFIQKPHNSWVLNQNTYQWDAPTPYPKDGKIYTWNEEILNWDEELEQLDRKP